MINDTVSGNITSGGAGGPSGKPDGGGIPGAATGGGLYAGGGSLGLINSTVALNSVASGGTGGGLDVEAGTAILNNTIVALNTSGTGGGATADDIAGTVSSASASNLIGTGGSGGLTNGVHGNLVGVADPGLGTLADNGGPTQTIALLTGSPAIDAGSNALAVDPTSGQPLTTDQRGTGFPRIIDGTVDIGAYELQYVTAVAVDWGTQSAPLQTAADGLRLLPAGRSTDLPWLGIDQVQVTLGFAVPPTRSDVEVTSAIGVNYGPVTIAGSGTGYTITLARPITEADRVTITIGDAAIGTYTRQIDVLPGDFNDDGVVNSQDLVGIRNEWLRIDGAVPTIFGDINGDGQVNAVDYNDVRERIGTALPAAGGEGVGSDAVVGGGAAMVRIGTGGTAAGGGQATRAAVARPRPRAEVALTARGRVRGVGSSVRLQSTRPGSAEWPAGMA